MRQNTSGPLSPPQLQTQTSPGCVLSRLYMDAECFKSLFLDGGKVPFGYHAGKGDCWVHKLHQGSQMRVKQLHQGSQMRVTAPSRQMRVKQLHQGSQMRVHGSRMRVKQPCNTNSTAGVVATLDLWPITNPPGICAPGILLRRSVGNETCIFTMD